MSIFLVALIGGFAGSFHCLGMCGGFACGLAQMNAGSRLKLLYKNTLYNCGRLLSYVFIGAVAGALGTSLVGHQPLDAVVAVNSINGNSQSMGMVLNGEAGVAQRLLSVVAGAAMLLMALQLLGLRRHLPVSWGRIGGVGFARAMQSLIRSNHPGASVTLGVMNGFLPCPLVFAFAAIAASSASISSGSITMLGFGLGTFPAMIFMGSVGLMLSPVIRQRGVRLSGLIIFLIGMVTIVRGLIPEMMHGASHAMHMQ